MYSPVFSRRFSVVIYNIKKNVSRNPEIMTQRCIKHKARWPRRTSDKTVPINEHIYAKL